MDNMLSLVDNRNVKMVLNALAKLLEVDELGAYTDEIKLVCCGFDRKLSLTGTGIVELNRFERLGKNGVSDWYELPFPEEFRTKLYDSVVKFKSYRFLKLEDIAYYLKMHRVDVEVIVARILLTQALGEGIYVKKPYGQNVKLGSLEELLVLADLNCSTKCGKRYESLQYE